MTERKSFNPIQPQPMLIVISGISASGKDSVIKRLRRRKLPFHFVITTTSRSPRKHERHGVDYYFVPKEEFIRMRDCGELLEWAVVYGDFKGIAKEQVRTALASGKDVILRVDVQGAATIRKLCPDAVLIFLTTESEEDMVQRLVSRGTDSDESIRKRVQQAYQELEQLDMFDYVVVNHAGQLSQTVDTIIDIIQAEHHRVHPRKVTL